MVFHLKWCNLVYQSNMSYYPNKRKIIKAFNILKLIIEALSLKLKKILILGNNGKTTNNQKQAKSAL